MSWAALGSAGIAMAQEATEDEASAEIVVVGSQIKGAKINEALPVTVVSTDEIRNSAAVSGDELFRSIPQFGDVQFNSQYLPGSSNGARGDIGSLDLRSLGIGNTLVLLNGRRVVAHPTSQANDQLVPVLSYNTNAIPVNGLERLEVLRDGAAAIYGADAVAGVVNTVLKTDYQGAELSLQYGGAEGTGLREFNGNGVIGTNFAENRGNITLFGSYDHGTGLESTEQYFTASSDKRDLFDGTRFEGATSLDGRSTTTPFANLRTYGNRAVIYNRTALTNASGQFHLQPTSSTGCVATVGNDRCIQNGAMATAGADRDLRYDTQAQGVSIMPRLNRINLFMTGHYDLSDDVSFFTEAGFYRSKTKAQQSPVATLSSIPVYVPASNYWNPLGQAVFANGTANPNRLAGTNAPTSGLPLTINNYLFEDFGPMNITVTNQQFRLLAGLRGEYKGFNWESAVSYSEAWARDVSDNISRTKLQEYLARSTPDAYNIFGTSVNSQSTIDAMREDLTRYTKSTLATYDFRVSKADLFTLPGGNVGFAAGIEARRETQLDDRDPRIDGTITYTDPLTGAAAGDFVNSALNSDTSGHREVFGAYAEFAVPVISPEMEIPLVQAFNVQLAGRYEHYSDFGDVAVPKVAAAWDVVRGIRFRGSWAKSFRAPNLEQTNATVVTRANTRTDWIMCEADELAGRITNFSQCSRAQITSARRSGNPDLKPERAKTLSFGVVLEPPLPEGVGNLTFTADWWRVRQTGLVGIFGEGNALILDYLLRKEGSSNPNVIRATPTASDDEAFAGTGLTPAGEVLYVLDQYTNLQPQTVKGLDFNLTYRTPETGIGRFNLAVNASHFLKYYQEPSPGIAALLAAQDAGDIDAAVNISGGRSLLQLDRKPKWRGSASLTWTLNNVTVGAFAQYTGKVYDTSLIDSDGDYWAVKATTTANLYAQYRFTQGSLDGTSVRLGVRNLFDKAPPLSSSGYQGQLYSPLRRYWYLNISHKF
ncbi:TonB-dependent receptor [Sphingobium sp. BYY-5]|uniref:TonB-dependent receptor domain-containing protein n=1 Tax=Sphingobium sp. BYY-5 TaxID=2926400 RepID=UPI001FA754BE|nr:TonB-dependent receptor [Sphingobium sp. BYY-5]MCI4592141.1 TonB-dependent receptor [Sphingobium sp. BYY-5]